MNLGRILIIGAAIGAREGACIFIERAEPYKVEILLAPTLNNVSVSVNTDLFLTTLRARTKIVPSFATGVSLRAPSFMSINSL